MTKAEERALEAYPDFDAGSAKVVQCFQRQCYINGYEQAEKDLALTWEDIRKIVVISEDVFEEGNNLLEEEYYEEVLKRFKETKK